MVWVSVIINDYLSLNKKFKGTINVMMTDGWFLTGQDSEKVNGQFLHAHWWLWPDSWPYCPLDRQKSGLRMIKMLLALSAPCVFPCGLMSITVLVWGLLLLWLLADSCLDNCLFTHWSCNAFTNSWSTKITLSFLKHAEDCFGYVYIFQPCDLGCLPKLHLKQDKFSAGQPGSLQGFFVWHVVLPFEAKDGVQAALVKTLK